MAIKETKVNRDKKVRSNENLSGGILVYGAGTHLYDMLAEHPDLPSRIARIFDNDKDKIGTKLKDFDKIVEGRESLAKLSSGTQVAVSELKYYREIVQELHTINPGLICTDIDQAYDAPVRVEMINLETKMHNGLLVYGAGSHLKDMLEWHKELAGRIIRIFDKDVSKNGKIYQGLGKNIEGLDALRVLPPGTRIAVSAIKYYDEIKQEIYNVNPGIVCQTIDEAYQGLKPLPEPRTIIKEVIKEKIVTTPVEKIVNNETIKEKNTLTVLQQQRLYGWQARARWRQWFLMKCVRCRHVFWGIEGGRANYLLGKFQLLMCESDILISEDESQRGKVFCGLPICVPDVLKDIRDEFVIIILGDNYNAVRECLIDYGYVENVDFVEGRQILGEDENGYIDVPCLEKYKSGMIVYGAGDSLMRMLNEHSEIARSIARVIDIDSEKIGTFLSGIAVPVEPAAVLHDLPSGTEIVISSEKKEITDVQGMVHKWNPGLICRSMDDVWQEYV